MPETKDGDSKPVSTTVPVVPGLSPSTVEAIRYRLRSQSVRKGRRYSYGFWSMTSGEGYILTYDAGTEQLTWERGEKPTFNEKIRDIEALKRAKGDEAK